MYQFKSILKISLNVIVYLFFFIFATDTKSVKETKNIATYDYALKYIMKAYIIIFVTIVTIIMNSMIS